VYRGVQLSVNRPVAIKLITATAPNQAELVKRFRREAEATACLSHPNTVRLFDFGVTETEELYMVMELLEGSDLSEHLQTHAALPLSEALQITRQVLQALSEAHARGIVHRDLKPGNVFLSRVRGGDIFAKVMDFGIAGIEQARESQKLTVTGAVIGTPAYMSPEQAQGRAVDARSDVYSVGVMLFEMLTGRPPFEADTVVSLLLAHVMQAPPRLADLAVNFPEREAVQALLDRWLAKAADARPPSAAAALADIAAVAAGVAKTARTELSSSALHSIGSSPTAGPGTPLGWSIAQRKPLSGRALRSAAFGLLGALLLGAGVLVWRQMATHVPAAPSPVATFQPEPIRPLYSVTLASSPKGASVLLDGAELGKTPYTVQFKSATVVKLALPGYAAQTITLDKDSDPNRAIELVPLRAKAAEHRLDSPAAQRNVESPAPANPRRSPVREVTHAVGGLVKSIFGRDDQRARRDGMLRGAPPYPSVAAAQRAYDAGRIDADAYEDAVWVLKAHRKQRIDAEKHNLERGSISPQEYEWRLGRIDAEYRGE
jgi:serine/threonine-protein kinase